MARVEKINKSIQTKFDDLDIEKHAANNCCLLALGTMQSNQLLHTSFL